MIIKAIKFTITFSISYLILSVPINKKPLFYYVSKLTSPYTDGILGTVVNNSASSLNEGKKLVRKVFSSEIPKDIEKREKSARKKSISGQKDLNYYDDYTDEERRLLEKALK